VSEQMKRKESEAVKKSREDLMNKVVGQRRRSSPANAFLSTYEQDVETDSSEEKKDSEKETRTKKTSSTKEEAPQTNEETTNLAKEIGEISQHVEESDDNFWEDLKKGRNVNRRRKVMTTFYLDPDLDDIISYLHEREGKGFKSKFLNESVRLALRKQGLL